MNICHEFGFSVVRFTLLLTETDEHGPSDTQQVTSGSQEHDASSGNCLSLDAASRKCPPRATYYKHMEGCWKFV